MEEKKKMSFEEFVDILNKTENDFDIIGFEGILNAIECLHWKMADEAKDAGEHILEEMYRRTARKMHEELEKHGYFD